MKKIIVIGATSAIAQAFCKETLKNNHHHFFLVGRDESKLKAIAQDLQVRGAKSVETHVQDLNELSSHADIINLAAAKMLGIDWALIAHGILGEQKTAEVNFTESLEIIQSNYLSQVSLLHHLANYMEKHKNGVIGVLSSVAGDRGRRSNYIYGSAKAGITAYLSGLRVRLNQVNVQVITVKMGFVDSPMTQNFKKGPLWAKPEQIAEKLVPLYQQQISREVYLPKFWFFVMTIIKFIPTKIFLKLKNL